MGGRRGREASRVGKPEFFPFPRAYRRLPTYLSVRCIAAQPLHQPQPIETLDPEKISLFLRAR
jgi:hypothetical protein